MSSRSKRDRLIGDEDGTPISVGATLGILMGVVLVGLIAATITLGVLYGQAKAALPQNTTTTTNLLFPAPTRRRTAAFANVLGLSALNMTLTTSVVETPAFYQISSTLSGTLTDAARKRGFATSTGYFNITEFFPTAHPGLSVVDSTVIIPVTFVEGTGDVHCTVSTGGTTLQCEITVATASLVTLGTITTPATLSYVINK